MAYSNTGLATRSYGNAAWNPQAIREGVAAIGDDPWKIYSEAQRVGVSGQQLDNAMGWNPGKSNAWATGMGFAPLQGMPSGPYMANADQASNDWIGRTTQPVAGVGSIAGQFGGGSNPYLGMTTPGVTAGQAQAGTNAYAGANPYLNETIDAALADVTRRYDMSTRPQLDAAMQASGSYGNTGVQAMQDESRRQLASELGKTASSMRMQDYNLQAQLGESAANRATQNSQFNTGNDLQARLANAGLTAADISRNLSGTQAQNALNSSTGLQAAMFDATNAQRTGEFNASLGANDLARNSQLAQALGQFNTGQTNAAGQFNAGQGNAYDQFNDSLDFSIDSNNWNRQRTGAQDQISALTSLLGMNNLGLGAADSRSQQPLNYLNNYASLLSQLAGQGGTTSQTQQGNPLLGLLGGALTASQLWK